MIWRTSGWLGKINDMKGLQGAYYWPMLSIIKSDDLGQWPMITTEYLVALNFVAAFPVPHQTLVEIKTSDTRQKQARRLQHLQQPSF